MFLIFSAALFLDYFPGYGSVRDSVSFKRHKIYIELPVLQTWYAISNPISSSKLLKLYTLRPMVSYGYQLKKGGEVAATIWAYPYVSPYPHEYKMDNNKYSNHSSNKSKTFGFQFQCEKRWFAFKKYQFQPWFGLFLPINVSVERNASLVIGSYPNNYREIKTNSTILSTGLGLSLGLRYSYKRWNALSFIQAIPTPLKLGFSSSVAKPNHDDFSMGLAFTVGFAF